MREFRQHNLISQLASDLSKRHQLHELLVSLVNNGKELLLNPEVSLLRAASEDLKKKLAEFKKVVRSYNSIVADPFLTDDCRREALERAGEHTLSVPPNIERWIQQIHLFRQQVDREIKLLEA